MPKPRLDPEVRPAYARARSYSTKVVLNRTKAINKKLVILLAALLPLAPLQASANDAVISIQCTLTGTSGPQETLPDVLNGTFNLWIYDVNGGGLGQAALERMGSSSVWWITNSKWTYVEVYPGSYAITLMNTPGIFVEQIGIDRSTGKGQFSIGRYVNGYAQAPFVASYNCIKSSAPLPKHRL